MNSPDPHTEALHIALTWVSNISTSVQARDLAAHMQLVSEQVQVYGMPNHEVLNYWQWQQRRKHEFRNHALLSVNYTNIKVINSTPQRLGFSAQETMLGSDGRMVVLQKKIILQKEQQRHWRVVEEIIEQWKAQKLDLDKRK